MTVESKVILTSNPNPIEIMQVLAKQAKNVAMRPTSEKDFVWIDFEWEHGKNSDLVTRRLSVFTGHLATKFTSDEEVDAPKDVVFLKFAHAETSAEIMDYLLEAFGGYVQYNDSTDEWKKLYETAK